MSNAIRYKGEIYAEDGAILSPGGSYYEAKELRADALEADSLQITVVSDSGTIRDFAVNDKVEYLRDGALKGIYYLQTVTRTGPRAYQLYALSAVGRLMVQPHVGGIYTGELAGDVIEDICGDLPVIVESVYRSRPVYGWLPYADGESRSARDNLADLLLDLGAYLHTDANGTLRVQKLWDGFSAVLQAGRVDARSARETTDQAVSAIAVTAHQYVAGDAQTILFSGTAEQETRVTFSAPMHSLAATGFTILESGANYAVLSAGSGELTGKEYVHSTTIVQRTATEGVPENVIPVASDTLISIVSAVDVAGRLAEYYRCRQTLTVDVNPRGERAGHVVMLQHPWDGALVPACIVSRETKISGLLKSRTTALVGFTPPRPEESEYFDAIEILTGSGEWEVPEGVTTYTKVQISGAQGGQAGQPGEDATAGKSVTMVDGTNYNAYAIGTGGKGGSGGTPGTGGRVLVETVENAVPGTKIPYSCGVGSEGSDDPDIPAALGTDTTMGGSSTASGTSSAEGYADPTTGKIYAAQGLDGIAGGDGASRDPEVMEYNVDTIRQFVPGADVTGEDGNVYHCGAVDEDPDDPGKVNFYRREMSGGRGTYSKGLGGGAAVGSDGSAGRDAPASGQKLESGPGGAGANASGVPAKPTLYGQGGRGGYGGGGGGAPGFVAASKSAGQIAAGTPGVGGAGAKGGPGADGCIILYYRKYAPKRAGWVREKNRRWLIDRLGRRIIV